MKRKTIIKLFKFFEFAVAVICLIFIIFSIREILTRNDGYVFLEEYNLCLMIPLFIVNLICAILISPKKNNKKLLAVILIINLPIMFIYSFLAFIADNYILFLIEIIFMLVLWLVYVYEKIYFE